MTTYREPLYIDIIFKVRTKPDGGAWSDWIEYDVGSRAKIVIDNLTLADYYDVEVKAEYAYFDRYSHEYSPYKKDFETMFNGQNFVDYDNLKCKCYVVDVFKSDKQYLNMLLAWGEGEIEGVSDSDIYINDQKLETYDDEIDTNGAEVAVTHRVGTVDQTTLPGFDDAVESVSGSFPYSLLNNLDTQTVEMTSTTCEKIIIGLKTFIYGVNSDGTRKEGHVDLKIETAPHGSGVWTDQTNGGVEIVGSDSQYMYKSFEIKGLTAGQYQVKLTRLSDSSPNSYEKAELYWQFFNAYSPVGYTYPGTALTSLQLLATDKLYGGMPNVYGIVKGLKITVPRIQISGSTVMYRNCYYDSYADVYRYFYGDTDYAADTECDSLTSNTETQWAYNPFWFYYTYLTNSVWGKGDKVPSAKISATEIMEAAKWADELVPTNSDDETDITVSSCGASTLVASGVSWSTDELVGYFVKVTNGTYTDQIRRVLSNTSNTLTLNVAWTDTPDGTTTTARLYKSMEKRFEFHGTLDRLMRVVDFLEAVLRTARSHPAMIGTVYTVVNDKVKSLTQVLTMGNTIENSFSEKVSFLKPTHFKATFLDADNNYETTMQEVINPDYSDGDKKNEITFDGFGLTRLSRVARELDYIMNKYRYCSRVANVSMMLDNIHSLPGDRIRVSNDIPEWGFSGRISEAGSDVDGSYVVLDDPITISAGKAYQLILRIDDEIVTKEVDEATTGLGTVTKVYITDSWSTTPEEFKDVWILQNSTDNVLGKDFTIEEIRRANDNSASVLLLEYNESVYDDNPVIPTPIYSNLVHRIPPTLDAINIDLDWRLNLPEKRFDPYLDISFFLDPSNEPEFVGKYKLIIYGCIKDGDTTAQTIAFKSNYTATIEQMSFSMPAQEFVGKTIYITAALMDQQNRTGNVYSPAVSKYVDLSWTPSVTSSCEVDTTQGTNGYDYYKDNYSIYLTWAPVGWYDNAGKWAPIFYWNSGDNYFSYSCCYLLAGFVDNTGDYPDFSAIGYMKLPDIGTIFDADGNLITDADTLDRICAKAITLKVDNLVYSSKWYAWTIVPILRDGRPVIDTTQDPVNGDGSYGLDWEWVQVQAPGGATTVENTSISNFELVYTLEPGMLQIVEIHWDYALEAPTIDGFSVFLRYQPYLWQWQTNAAYNIGNTGKPSMNTALGGGTAAYTDYIANMTKWKTEGLQYCFFLLSNATYHEVIRVDLQSSTPAGTWVVTRGAEGTTERSWASGTTISHACSEWTDAIIFLDDTTKRTYVIDAPADVNNAIHMSIVAVKLVSESPGYLRSNLAFWTATQQR